MIHSSSRLSINHSSVRFDSSTQSIESIVNNKIIFTSYKQSQVKPSPIRSMK